MKNFAILLLVLFFCPIVNGVSATEPSDVEAVVELMYTSKSVITRKVYEDGSLQVVFRKGGLRYTFYYHPDEKDSFLSVWVRPNGTHGQKTMETFSDSTLNGRVDFGIKGGDNDERYYVSGEELLLERKGSQYEKYWQKQYDKAIKDALLRLKGK